MLKNTWFKNISQFDFLDGKKIEIITEKKLKIYTDNDVYNFCDESTDSDNKKTTEFNSGTGEQVIEYSGLKTDDNEQRSIAKATFAPEGRSAKHYHKDRVEDYYILSGVADIIVDDKTYHLKAGSHLRIDKNQIHQVINPSSTEAFVLLVLCEPAWTIKDFYPIADVTSMAQNQLELK